MHKSGKHWVRTVMSQIGLMRLFKGAKVEEVAISQVEETLKDVSVSHHILKSAAALGALAAGGVASQTALAEETPAVETKSLRYSMTLSLIVTVMLHQQQLLSL